MLNTTFAIMALASLAGATELSGTVRDAQGAAVPGARVFLELGLAGPVAEGTVGPDGRFSFPEVPPGQLGVFAVAEGFGFGGASLTVGVEDQLPDFAIVLRRATTREGRVENAQGEAVEGVRITRLLLLDPYKVGIPLAKMAGLGVEEPVTDGKGRYRLDSIPAGVPLGLKAAHPRYAQEALVLDDGGDVVLHRGVLVQGDVVTRGGNRPVSDAWVVIKNAQPPHETAVTRTGGRGEFSLRLKPGVYVYHSEAEGLQSPGGKQLVVFGDRPQPRARLLVAGTGKVTGTVQDALTSAPIEDVRLALKTEGHLAAITRTGPTGRYAFDVTEGACVVELANAPGYLPPETRAYRVAVTEGETIELAGLFLRPLPSFRLRVLKPDGESAAGGAVVTLLRPQHFGWQVADGEGWVRLEAGQLPPDGRIVGIAEHPRLAAGALFALSLRDAPEARVQLLPLARVSGTVATDRGKGLAGVRVAGVYPGAVEEEPLTLWRTVSAEDGAWAWPAVLPGVPQRLVAGGEAGVTAEGALFNLAPEGNRAGDTLALERSAAAESLRGAMLRWPDGRGGTASAGDIPQLSGRPGVVFFCGTGETGVVAESAARARQALGSDAVGFAVVAGSAPSDDAPVPVVGGMNPGTATTYVVDAAGRVVLETFDMPPAHYLGSL